MDTWTNKAFQIRTTEQGQSLMAHMIDENSVIIFRWRLYYYKPGDVIENDQEIYEEFNVPFGIIKHFETFTALCRQFDTPNDANDWYLKKIGGQHASK